MRTNRIKQIWRDGKCVTLGWLSVPNSFTAEVMARQGFDALCVDLQHGLNELSKASICPLLKFVASKNRFPSITAIVTPLYTAPAAGVGICELSALSTALFAFTPGFQAATVPSSVTQMNSAGLPGASRKSVALPLKTMPVGVPLPG